MLPDFGLGAGLAELGPAARREPVQRFRRKIRDRRCRRPHGSEIRRSAGKLPVQHLVGVADLLHPLVALVHDLQELVPRGRGGGEQNDSRRRGKQRKTHAYSYRWGFQLSSIILMMPEKSFEPPPRSTNR